MRTGYYVTIGLTLLLGACFGGRPAADPALVATTTAGPTPTEQATEETVQDSPIEEPLLCETIDDESMVTYAQEVVELTNMERGKVNADPLALRAELTQAAKVHAMDMACNLIFSHTGSDGSSPFDRMARVGYQFRAAAENIAAGQASPAAVVQGWMESPGHRENMLNPGYTEIGVGYIFNHAEAPEGNYLHYWVMTLGQPAWP
jgi:uncharacterized protein YkwD